MSRPFASRKDWATATSIHVYSPELGRMGYYDPDPSGLLRRTSISYAEELVPAA